MRECVRACLRECVEFVCACALVPVSNTPISKAHHSIHNMSMPGIEIRANFPQSCRLSVVQPTIGTSITSKRAALFVF